MAKREITTKSILRCSASKAMLLAFARGHRRIPEHYRQSERIVCKARDVAVNAYGGEEIAEFDWSKTKNPFGSRFVEEVR